MKLLHTNTSIARDEAAASESAIDCHGIVQPPAGRSVNRSRAITHTLTPAVAVRLYQTPISPKCIDRVVVNVAVVGLSSLSLLGISRSIASSPYTPALTVAAAVVCICTKKQKAQLTKGTNNEHVSRVVCLSERRSSGCVRSFARRTRSSKRLVAIIKPRDRG